MRTRVINLSVMAGAISLLAVYLFLNYQKLEVVSSDWADIKAGSASSSIKLQLDGELVYQQRLKDSEIFDVAGVRQIYFIHLPENLYARVKKYIQAASLLIDKKSVPLSATKKRAALLGVTEDRRIYLLEEGELKYMMTVIWNERLHANNITRCSTAEMCQSVRISSNHWGPIQGPFLDSDISPDRRGMPKGRWVKGPKAVLNIQSNKPQKVRMQINLLGIHKDQELVVTGADSQVQKIESDTNPLEAGGGLLYPGVYDVLLDLQPGANLLELTFSKWRGPVRDGANPLAAYITVIGMKGTG